MKWCEAELDRMGGEFWISHLESCSLTPQIQYSVMVTITGSGSGSGGWGCPLLPVPCSRVGGGSHRQPTMTACGTNHGISKKNLYNHIFVGAYRVSVRPLDK